MSNLQLLNPRDRFLPLDDALAEQRQILVLGEGTKRRFAVLYAEELDELVSLPDDLAIFKIPPRESDDSRMLGILENIISFVLESSSRERLSFDRLKDVIRAKNVVDPQLVEPAIRFLLSEGLLVASRPKNGTGTVTIKLTAEGRKNERIRSYATSAALDLKERSQKLGQLIGHGPTLGAEKEELVRSFLEQRLPRRYHVATGFVEGFDRQIDVLIYDQIDYAPLFRSGNLVVIPREAVRAVIEVKSNLSKSEINKALPQINSSIRQRWPAPPVFRGIFAFDGAKAPVLVEEWKKFHRLPSENPDDGVLYEPITDIYSMIDAICVLDQTILISTFTDEWEGDEVSPFPVIEEYESYAGRPLQAAMFFDLLDRYLRFPPVDPILRIPLAPYFHIDVAVKDVHPFYGNGTLARFLGKKESLRLSKEQATFTQWVQAGPWDVIP